LNKPSEITEKVVTGGKGYDEALKSRFERESTRKFVSFGARLVLDPLNLIPVAKLGKVAQLGSKIDDAARASKVLSPILSKVDDVSKAAKATIAKVDQLPFYSKTKEALGTRFVKGYGLPEQYNLAKGEMPLKTALGVEEIVKRTAQQFKGVAGDREIIEAIPKFLEPRGAGAGTNLGELRKMIDTTRGAGYFEKEVRPIMREVSKQFDDDIIDLVKRGRVNGEAAKTMLTQGGYYPHTDFATDSLKEYFRAFRVGEKRGYLKRREGYEGFTFNAPKAIAKREYAQFQDNVVQDFLLDVKKSFGVTTGAGKSAPAGYTAFGNTTGRLKEMSGYAVPERIFKDLNETFSPAGGFARAIDGFNRVWKPTATSMNPAFHIQNMIGNMYNSWLGGMKDPRRFIQSIKGGFSPEETAVLKKSGILSRGQFGADLIQRTFDKPEGLKALRLIEPFRKTGEFFENNARSAFLLDRRTALLRKGLDDVTATRQAIAETNKYLFDYLSGLTPFETNVMRRAFPFYTWARFNIPLQFRSIITQPNKVAVVAKVNRFANDGTDFREGDQQPGINFPTPFVDSEGKAIRFRPSLPVQDIFGINPKRIIGMLNPLAKEVTEGVRYMGTPDTISYDDLYTGREITNKNLPASVQARDILKNRATSMIRPLRSSQRIADEDFSPQGILRQVIGGTYTYDPEQVELQQIYKDNRKNKALQDRIQLLMRDKTLDVEEKKVKIQEIQNFMRNLQ